MSKSKRDKPVHVTPRAQGWAVVREGNSKASWLYETQGEAEMAGREAARRDRTEFLLHGKDGRIRERDSYGRDPYPPRG